MKVTTATLKQVDIVVYTIYMSNEDVPIIDALFGRHYTDEEIVKLAIEIAKVKDPSFDEAFIEEIAISRQ